MLEQSQSGGISEDPEEVTRPAGSAPSRESGMCVQATEMWEPVGSPEWPVGLAGGGLK